MTDITIEKYTKDTYLLKECSRVLDYDELNRLYIQIKRILEEDEF